MVVFQITEEIIYRSSTLGPEDIGKWCYLVQGCMHGFCETKEEAERNWHEVFANNNVRKTSIK